MTDLSAPKVYGPQFTDKSKASTAPNRRYYSSQSVKKKSVVLPMLGSIIVVAITAVCIFVVYMAFSILMTERGYL